MATKRWRKDEILITKQQTCNKKELAKQLLYKTVRTMSSCDQVAGFSNFWPLRGYWFISLGIWDKSTVNAKASTNWCAESFVGPGLFMSIVLSLRSQKWGTYLCLSLSIFAVSKQIKQVIACFTFSLAQSSHSQQFSRSCLPQVSELGGFHLHSF